MRTCALIALGYRAKRWRHMSTSGWRELLADFATGPQTRLIAIKIMRNPEIR
jgi:hypothetical protein